MTKLNRKVEYALMALKFMRSKKPGELTSVKEIVGQFGSSFDLTSRVLQRLGSAGILRSVQGAQGGYQIVKDLSDVSFYSVSSLLTEPMGLTRCVQEGGAECDFLDSCNIILPMKNLNEQLKVFYRNLSVASLLDGPAGDEMVQEASSGR